LPAGTPVVAVSPAKPVPRGKTWIKWAAAGSVFLALMIGAFGGWVRNADVVIPPLDTEQIRAVRTTIPKEPGPSEPLLSSQREREQWLVAELKQYGKPGEVKEQLEFGLNYNIELGLLYLDNWRLDDAQKLFKDLDRVGKHDAYRILGRVGQAIVLAFQDRPQESNRLFVEVFRPLARRAGPNAFGPDRARAVNAIASHRQVRMMIARALEHNQANARQHFPRGLVYFLHPPGFFLPSWANEEE
jgi:hypothetical protein